MISIAWCSYQANQWSGVQTFKLGNANNDNTQASDLNLQQGPQTSVAVLIFRHYFDGVLKRH